MNDNEINKRVAECCGWSDCRLVIKGPGGGTRTPTAHGFPHGRSYEAPCPDYCTDLNAVHTAEKVLTKEQQKQWLDWLDVACGGELEMSAMLEGTEFLFYLVTATARQRAEALLRTLNLWADS